MSEFDEATKQVISRSFQFGYMLAENLGGAAEKASLKEMIRGLRDIANDELTLFDSPADVAKFVEESCSPEVAEVLPDRLRQEREYQRRLAEVILEQFKPAK